MADYTAIAGVGETLVELLQDRMENFIDGDEIALASPNDVGQGNDWRLTLYLYRVSESSHMKNAEPRGQAPDPTVTKGSPLVLDLHYLLTAHPSKGRSDGTAKTTEQHSVLGRAMQVFRDNAIIRGSDLKGSLGAEDKLHLTIESESMDAMVNMWSTFPEQPFHPSVSYLVTPVVIDSRREEPVKRIVEREVNEYTIASEETDGE